MTEARIYSQGFRQYDGPRTGPKGALKSLQKQSLRQSLGLGRGIGYKVVPICMFLAAAVPVIFFVGVAIGAIVLGEPIKSLALETIPDAGAFFGWINIFTVVLAAYTAPLLLSNDRRTGMLGVYLAGPLDRLRYILAKFWATGVTLATVVVVPSLLVFLSLTAIGEGPDGFGEWIKTFALILIASVAICVFYAAVSLALASLTDRQSIGWIIFIGVAMVTGGFSLISEIDDSLAWLGNFSITSTAPALARRIASPDTEGLIPSTISIIATYVAIVSASIAVIWWQYRRPVSYTHLTLPTICSV